METIGNGSFWTASGVLIRGSTVYDICMTCSPLLLGAGEESGSELYRTPA